jgi:cobalamin-dependent methionine synthase I
VISAAGRGGMPSGTDDRVANASEMVEAATSRGIALNRLHVDNLVLPVAVDGSHGTYFLEAVRRVRAAFGPEIHLTGGLSNVSFGLPERRLLNDVFIDLAVEAGADSGIIDPLANDLDRVFARDRGSLPYRLAADVLQGRDAYGGAYLAAFRRGELEATPA